MNTPEDRGINEWEIAVIEWTLRNGSAVGSLEHLVPTLGRLRVVSRCGCGCASVTFVAHDPQNPSKPIANAVGTAPGGLKMGVIVWGRMDEVTGLELWDVDELASWSLPDPATLRRFEPAS